MTPRSPLILVCDDEPVLRELIGVALGGRYRLTEAGTVEEALAAMALEPPDVILLDLMIPGGGGLAVLREIRTSPALRDVRVAVVSAWADDAHRREAEEHGADVFLAKPFDPVHLERLVADLLARPKGADGA